MVWHARRPQEEGSPEGRWQVAGDRPLISSVRGLDGADVQG